MSDAKGLMEHRVAEAGDVRERKGCLVHVRGKEIALFRVEGKVFAVGNICPHQHFSKLHEGELNGFTLTCPMHGWTYDVRTGVSTNANGRIETYDVVVRGGGVFVQTHGDTD